MLLFRSWAKIEAYIHPCHSHIWLRSCHHTNPAHTHDPAAGISFEESIPASRCMSSRAPLPTAAESAETTSRCSKKPAGFLDHTSIAAWLTSDRICGKTTARLWLAAGHGCRRGNDNSARARCNRTAAFKHVERICAERPGSG